MGLRTILLKEDAALHKTCRPVTEFNQKLWDLMDDLKDTMIEADGLGLAAPQVGILRRAVVIVRDDEVVELINPEIIARGEEELGAFEGCLSCPNQRAYIMRPAEVTVRAQDRNGEWFELECFDMAARAACHEIDHLDGTLFIDLADRVYTDEELDELFAQEEE